MLNVKRQVRMEVNERDLLNVLESMLCDLSSECVATLNMLCIIELAARKKERDEASQERF